jgi:hypothetical protein
MQSDTIDHKARDRTVRRLHFMQSRAQRVEPLGVPISTEKKTTNFRLTPVQKALSQTTVIEKP